MCWSTEVALGFGLTEVVILFYLFYRNRDFDRCNVLLHIPLAVQELLQAALWPHVTEGECSATNRAISYAVAVVVGGVPAWFNFIASMYQSALLEFLVAPTLDQVRAGLCPQGHQLESVDIERKGYCCSVCRLDELPFPTTVLVCKHPCNFGACATCIACAKSSHRPEAPSWALTLLGKTPSNWANVVPTKLRKLTRRHVVRCVFWLWLPGLLLAAARSFYPEYVPLPFLLSGPACTERGPHGHQVWPMLVWNYLPTKIILCAMYMMMGGGFRCVPKPSYCPVIFSCLGAFVVILYVFIGDEWGSVWCWLASLMVIMYLIEPFLFRRFRVFDAECLENSSDAQELRKSLGRAFVVAREHLDKNMMPWQVGPSCAVELEDAPGLGDPTRPDSPAQATKLETWGAATSDADVNVLDIFAALKRVRGYT